MAASIVVAKAKALLPLIIELNGVISREKLQTVAREILESTYPDKREIVRQLAALAESIQLRQLAEVTSAVELSKSTQEALSAVIISRHPEVKQFTWSIDPGLLGGFTIRVADIWYDTSVAADLETIREQLSR